MKSKYEQAKEAEIRKQDILRLRDLVRSGEYNVPAPLIAQAIFHKLKLYS